MANEDAVTITNNHERTQRVYHVFVSFSRSDTRFTLVGNLFTALIRESFKTFTDDENLMGGNQNNLLLIYVYRTLPRYDVFLSFSEQDTRYSFSGHLYNALNEEGFQTFMKDIIRKEDQTSESLVKVIEKSRLSIIVLSENYAYSSSCLDELVTILDFMKKNNNNQLLVWPIFYKVEPTIIRYQKNSYEKAMNEHEIEYGKDSEKVKAWRSALFEIASLNGRHLKDGYDYEYQFVEKIVKAAIKI